MKFLKNFSFDIQKFALSETELLLSAAENAIGGATSGTLYMNSEHTAVNISGGDGYYALGTFTVDGYNIHFQSVDTSTIVTFNVAGADRGWNVVGKYGVETVVTGADTGGGTASSEGAVGCFYVNRFDTVLTYGTWKAITNETKISTGAVVTADVASNKFTITAAPNSTVSATYTGAADITAVKNGTITVDASSTAATKFTSATNGSVITVAAKSAAEFSVNDGGVMTLASGTYTNDSFAQGTNPVKISGEITYDDAVFTSVTGTITGAGAVNVTAGTVALKATSHLTSVTAHGIQYTTAATSTVATFNGETGAISDFTGGTIQGSAGVGITLDGVEYKDSNDGQVTVASNGTKKGASASTNGLVGVAGKTYQLMNGAATGETVTVGSESNGVTIKISSGAAQVAYNTLDKVGESFTITDTDGSYRTYTLIAEGIVEQNDNGTKSYKNALTSGSYELASSLDDYSGSGLITTSNVFSAAGTYNVNAVGFVISTGSVDNSAAATVVVSSGVKTITARSAIAGGITITGDSDAVTITDNKSGNSYTVAVNSNFTLASGGSFKVTSGVISDATAATIFKLSAGAYGIVAKGTANVDASASTSAAAVTFQAGNSVSGAKITLAADKYFTLTETNTGNSAVDTVLNMNAKTLTGVDGDASIKAFGVTSTELASITTATSGTFTYNTTTATVAGDKDGVTFALTGDTVNIISGLDQDATVTLGKLSGAALVRVNTTAFTNITAKSGAVFTGLKADKSAANLTLAAKGDTVTIGTALYTVETMGSSGDGVVIGAISLAALNDGDKITVEDTVVGYKYTYEVSGNMMVVTDKAGTQTTWTLSDSSDTGFTVSDVSVAPSKATINGDQGQTAAVTFGSIGGTTAQTSLTDGIYINAEGKETTGSSKAVAKVSVQDDVVTYASQSSKTQTVIVTAGDTNTWNITTGAGKDIVTVSNNSDATIDSGAGDDAITVGGTGNRVIKTGDGKNTVTVTGTGTTTINLGAGKDTATATATNTGDLTITATGGNNEINLSAKTKGDVTVTGGFGNDTITASGTDDTINGGDGKDVFVVGKGITVSDYSFDNDVIFTNGLGFGVTDEGKVTTTGGVAVISATAGGFYAAQIKTTANGKAQNWAWAKDGGSTIDITSYTKDAYLQGDADGASALYAGSGDDVITALADGDSVYGGAGKNTINLGSGEKRVVGVSVAAKGKDTVSGFNTSFEDEGDSFYMVDGSLSDATVTVDSVSGSSANLTLKNNGASVSLVGAGVSTVTGAVEIKVGTSRLAAIASGKTATVESASYADAYIGKNSAVDFSKVDGDLYVDLSNGLSASGTGAKFVGVTSVTGGAGASTLMGSAKADSIVAGTGKSSLYGGAGADTLVGGDDSDMFFIGENTGNNTVDQYQAAGSDTADTVKILGDVTIAKLNGSTIELGTTDGSKAVIKSLASGSIGANTMVKIESNNFTGVAKIGSSSVANNFTYDSSVTYYGGGRASDKISVASGFSDNAEVWLDGSKGVAYTSVDVVDFSSGSADYILAGNSDKNTIVGGKGSSSLWGGTGSSADSVVGTAGGTAQFFYGLGEGNDTLVAASSNDNVNLYNISLSDITAGEITGSGVKLTTTAGDNVWVSTGNKNIKFTLSDGSTYTANQSTKQWE